MFQNEVDRSVAPTEPRLAAAWAVRALQCSLVHATAPRQPAGTPPYMAPEVHASQPYGFGRDVWAIGVTLWEAPSLNNFALQRHSPPYTSCGCLRSKQCRHRVSSISPAIYGLSSPISSSPKPLAPRPQEPSASSTDSPAPPALRAGEDDVPVVSWHFLV